MQGYIDQALDEHPGSVRVASACTGDGRDLIGVLSRRPDAERVHATLLEAHPRIAERVRQAAAAAGLAGVQVHMADAGSTDAYAGLVPADLVLLVGIFGNISDEDLHRTIATSPQLRSPGATLGWSRGRDDAVRAWFAEAGFTELDYATRDSGSLPAAGAMRYDGRLRPLVPGQALFTFHR